MGDKRLYMARATVTAMFVSDAQGADSLQRKAERAICEEVIENGAALLKPTVKPILSGRQIPHDLHGTYPWFGQQDVQCEEYLPNSGSDRR